MKFALFIISSSLVVSANAEGANRVVGSHQDPQDEEGLRRVAEHRGAKLRGRTPAARRHLIESMSMSAPIFEAEASISMPTRFIVPAELSMSMPLPKSTPAALEEEAEDVEEPKLFAKSEKPARRTLAARRHLMESMSMSAPIFEAEASISMPTRFIVPAELSMSMPLPKSSPAALEEEAEDVEEPKLFAKSEKPARRTLAARRHLMESMSMSAPIFEAEASISMPTRFIVPAELSMSMPLPKSTPAALEKEAEDVEEPKLSAKSEKPARRLL